MPEAAVSGLTDVQTGRQRVRVSGREGFVSTEELCFWSPGRAGNSLGGALEARLCVVIGIAPR